MQGTTVRVRRKGGRIHVDYGDPNGVRATVSPMETALALEVERLTAGTAAPRDAVATVRVRRELDVLRRTVEAERRRASRAYLDADVLNLALTGLLAAVGSGDEAAMADAVADAVELLAEIGSTEVVLAA
jgi:hypothetical protein